MVYNKHIFYSVFYNSLGHQNPHKCITASFYKRVVVR